MSNVNEDTNSSRFEQYLESCLDGDTKNLPKPLSRGEALLYGIVDRVTTPPDLSQNDETAPDYVQNRTHYDYKEYVTVVDVDAKFYQTDSTTPDYFHFNGRNVFGPIYYNNPIVGQKYRVTIGDLQAEGAAKIYSAKVSPTGYISLEIVGNPYLVAVNQGYVRRYTYEEVIEMGWIDTGEDWAYVESSIVVRDTSASGDRSITRSCKVEEVHDKVKTLDERFVPISTLPMTVTIIPTYDDTGTLSDLTPDTTFAEISQAITDGRHIECVIGQMILQLTSSGVLNAYSGGLGVQISADHHLFSAMAAHNFYYSVLLADDGGISFQCNGKDIFSKL